MAWVSWAPGSEEGVGSINRMECGWLHCVSGHEAVGPLHSRPLFLMITVANALIITQE